MNTTIRSFVGAATVFGASLVTLNAAPVSYDFKDPKGVNNVQFQLDAPLESISGTATGISGAIVYDTTQPLSTKGRIVLETKSLTVGNPMMREHLLGANWLDAEKFPEIVFEAVSVANVRTEGAQVLADVTGKLTVKGVTREVSVPVTFTHLPGKLGARLGDPKLKGDLLVLRAKFTISRSDYGIQAGQSTDKVSDTIHLSLSIAGAAPQS